MPLFGNNIWGFILETAANNKYFLPGSKMIDLILKLIFISLLIWKWGALSYNYNIKNWKKDDILNIWSKFQTFLSEM